MNSPVGTMLPRAWYDDSMATRATDAPAPVLQFAADNVCSPLRTTSAKLRATVDQSLQLTTSGALDSKRWLDSPYRPTSTIVEAARALYAQHSVEAIARHDAGAKNLHTTTRRDEALRDPEPPADHVVIFDEAQRAWNAKKTSSFMRQKKGQPDFVHSEPAFLISYLDRHEDWAVVICLVGGGQEIHSGEAGISEWLEAANKHFPQWDLYISSQLTDSEFAAGNTLGMLQGKES